MNGIFSGVLLFIFILFSGISYSQQTYADIKEIQVELADSNFDAEIFYENLYLFQDDSIDSSDIEFIIHSEMINMLLIKVATDSSRTNFQPFTYHALKQEFLQVIAIDEYESSKTLFFKMVEIMNTQPSKEHWPEHASIFEELEWKPEIILEIKALIYSKELTFKSYSEIIQHLEDQKEKTLKEYENKIFISEAKYYTHQELLNIAKTSKKPLVLYFSAWSCVNARKFEEYVLNTIEIADEIVNHFNLIILKVDDRTELLQNQKFISEINNREINTIGSNNLYLQLKIAATSAQPFFVFYNRNAEITTTADYNNANIQDFSEALKTAKEKY